MSINSGIRRAPLQVRSVPVWQEREALGGLGADTVIAAAIEHSEEGTGWGESAWKMSLRSCLAVASTQD